MSTKKLINNLLDKLKTIDDPIEREDLEDQILRLVEQDEIIDNMTKLDLSCSTSEISSKSNIDLDSELESREKIRLERESQRKDKEEQYKLASKLDSKDEELLRTEMLNQALASNDEYALKKQRKPTGAKNKNKQY